MVVDGQEGLDSMEEETAAQSIQNDKSEADKAEGDGGTDANKDDEVLGTVAKFDGVIAILVQPLLYEMLVLENKIFTEKWRMMFGYPVLGSKIVGRMVSLFQAPR